MGIGRPGGKCIGLSMVATGSLFSVAGVGGAFPCTIRRARRSSAFLRDSAGERCLRGKGNIKGGEKNKKKKEKKKREFFFSFNWFYIMNRQARTKHSRAAKELTCIGGGPLSID